MLQLQPDQGNRVHTTKPCNQSSATGPRHLTSDTFGQNGQLCDVAFLYFVASGKIISRKNKGQCFDFFERINFSNALGLADTLDSVLSTRN